MARRSVGAGVKEPRPRYVILVDGEAHVYGWRHLEGCRNRAAELAARDPRRRVIVAEVLEEIGRPAGEPVAVPIAGQLEMGV